MKPQRKIWWNGKILPEGKAKISIYDSGCMFGDMVFEMTRSFNGFHFKLNEHLDRLFMGLKILRIDIPYDKNDLMCAIKKLTEINNKAFQKGDEHRILISVTRGLLSIYEDVIDVEKGPNVIITDFPLRWTVSSMGNLFDTGINMVIPSQRTIPAQYLDPNIKNRSRLHYQMANIEVSQYKGDNNWALLLDDNGYIAEGTGDNFFIVEFIQEYTSEGIQTVLVKTPKGKNILRGISRGFIKTLCDKYNIEEGGKYSNNYIELEYVEEDITPYDVYNAHEAFITGTPFCMLPVTSLNGIKINIGKAKKYLVYNELLKMWSESVSLDIEKQIKEYSKDNKRNGITPYNFGKGVKK